MARNLAEQKSILAKLLAAENINIIHESIPTPYFDLKTRSLHCPTLKDQGEITEAIYDLFMSHEIGHALFTPPQAWHNAILKCRDPAHITDNDHEATCLDMALKDFINVTDDARIEAEMKRRFPGLREPYRQAYKYLHEDVNIFKVKGLSQAELDALPLIDRINLHFKIGHLITLNFSHAEKKYVDALSVVRKFEDMVVIARSIYKYQSEHKTPNMDDLTSALNKMGVKTGKNAGCGNGVETDDPNQSYTDQAMRDNEKKLYDDNKIVSIELPRVYLRNIVKSSKTIYDQFVHENPLAQATGKCRESLQWFVRKNKSYVEFLINQFLMKKNATDFARIKIHKTGNIDSNLLNRYFYSDDIFKTMTETIKGKSHGMVMILDMSGSMEGVNMYFALEQILTLTMFCQKVGIPFDVYGFSDVGTDSTKPSFGKDSQIRLHNFWLRQLISSSDTATMQKSCQEMLAYAAHSAICSLTGTPHAFQAIYPDIPVPSDKDALSYHRGVFAMSGTPLTAAIISSRHIIEQFKKKTGIDIVNCIYLTDGAGGDGGINASNVKLSGGYGHEYRYHVTDPVTREFVITDAENFQGDMVKLVQKITDVRHVGYYICSHRTAEMYVQNVTSSSSYSKWKKQHPHHGDASLTLAKHGYASLPSLGFDSYYYIAMEMYIGNLTTQEQLQTKTVNNPNSEEALKEMYHDFLTLHGNKKSQRIILSKFIDDIASRL